jgi:hypothetical protein
MEKKRESAKDKRIRLALEDQIRRQSEWEEFAKSYHKNLMELVYNYMASPILEVEAEANAFLFSRAKDYLQIKLPLELPNEYNADIQYNYNEVCFELDDVKKAEEAERELQKRIAAVKAKLSKEELELLISEYDR